VAWNRKSWENIYNAFRVAKYSLHTMKQKAEGNKAFKKCTLRSFFHAENIALP
jgi:hypothetical protein